MLKRELKINLKSLIIWTSICLILFLCAFCIYPSIMNSENAVMLNEMLKAFPDEMLKAFNMDISGIDSVYGWFKTEGYIILLLVMSIYSSILGSNILLKEEDDKTIEFLYSKPITRNKIVTSRIMAGLINIISFVLVVTIFNMVGMALSNDLDFVPFLLLSISPLLVCIPLFLISMYVSLYFRKTRKTITVAIGIAFISYFFSVISGLSEKVDFIKYFSIFTLTDSRNIITNGNMNILCILIATIISRFTVFMVYDKYNKKELV